MSKSKNKIEEVRDEPIEAAGEEGVETPTHDASTESRANEDTADLDDSETSKTPQQKLAEERDKLQSQLQRTLADLQNFRKRRAQEMTDVRRAAIEAMTADLLPILDNFHLATTIGSSTGDEATRSIQEGLEMVRGMLESVFERYGVQEIPADGTRFDPLVHEAVGIDPDPEAEEGVVTQILQRGYSIDGKVIRPTRVMVGGTPPSSTGEDGDC